VDDIASFTMSDTTTTINGLDPKYVSKAKEQAAREERYRITLLREMRLPGLEMIIDRAIAQGHDPNDVALECCQALKMKSECDAQVAKLKRDASFCDAVPAGDAPLDHKTETKANDNIVAAFRKKKPR
jgi:hypothetical protein